MVPTFGFVVEDDCSAVVVSGDTCATEALWRLANTRPNLKAVFLEVSFPNALESLAAVSKHHTPISFAREIRKVHRPAAFYAYHIKPRHVGPILTELRELNLPSVEIAQPGMPYLF